MRMLPLAVLNIGVTITPKDNTPSAYGPIDHALCGVPLSRKAGKCHKPQMAPRMRLAHSGANRRCNSGSAKPRQPNSSPTGPIKSVVASAGSKVYQGENGKGSSIVPFMAAPQVLHRRNAENQERPPPDRHPPERDALEEAA